MGEHARCGDEAALDRRRPVSGAQRRDCVGHAPGPAQPEYRSMVLRQAPLDCHEAGDALDQPADAVILGAGDEDEAAGRSPLQRFGETHLVLAAVTAGKHQRDIVAVAFRHRRDGEAGALQRQEVGTEALDAGDRGGKARRLAERSRGAEEERARSRRGQIQRPAGERMEEGLQRLGGHLRAGRFPAVTGLGKAGVPRPTRLAQ